MSNRVVLYMLGSFGPGGAERQLLTLLGALDRSRWTPVVLAMRDGILADEFHRLATTYAIGKRRKIEPSVPFRIRRIIDKHKPDVVHTQMPTANSWGRAAIALRPIGRPVVIATELSIDNWKRWYHLAIDHAFMPLTDAVLGNSQAVARYLIEHDRLPARKVFYIPNGLDLARAQRHLREPEQDRIRRRASLGLAPTDFVIGHVGRPTKPKRIDILLDVFERVHRDIPGAKLLRVTQDPRPYEVPIAEAFAQGVHMRGLDESVIIHPFTDDISAMMSMFDVLVQTSSEEGLPNVVMEAMAMNVPVVATAAGGTPELVAHAETGWLTPICDTDTLVEGIRNAHDNPDRVRTWATAARRLIESDYSDRSMADRTVELYEQLLQKRI